MNQRLLFAAAAALCIAGPAAAVNDCSLDGQYVNPDNGASTAGKTGLLRCKDRDTGAMQREQELRDGKYIGIVRFFKHGQVEREYSVDERGNRTGLSREWKVEADGRRTLVREETVKGGDNVGITKTWWPGGQRRSLSWQGEDKREQSASAEFRAEGQLSDLRCAKQPVFGAEFDDKAACGFAGKPSTVTLYGAKGVAQQRITFEQGERRKVETLWESGALRNVREIGGTGQVERGFAADGTLLREQQWTGRVKVLDKQFHASGKLTEEKRWKADERGYPQLVSDSSWYLNGQPKAVDEYAEEGGKVTRRSTYFHDNGKLASEGHWFSAGRNARELPVGVHKRFDEDGQLSQESWYDEKGRVTRERVLEKGSVVRDDEVFEDGSRKSKGR